MLVYRFEYENNIQGIYNHNQTVYRKKAWNTYKKLTKYSETQHKKYGISVHPCFEKYVNHGLIFGLNSTQQFLRWFPEVLLKKIIKTKSKYLKFCVFEVPKKYVVSDDNQCQFDRDHAKLVIKCNMGCINIKG